MRIGASAFWIGISNAAWAVPLLVDALKDKDQKVRHRAAMGLGALRAEPLSSIPALINALDDRSDSVRARATRGLGMFGSLATNAVPKLRELSNDADPLVRDWAISALEQISAESSPKPAPE
jgi:HEAT repeat protein